MAIRRIGLVILMGILLASCFACRPNTVAPAPTVTASSTPKPASTATQTDAPTSTPTVTPDIAEQYLQTMTTEEKVAQLFIIFPEAMVSGNRVVTAVDQEVKDFMQTYPVGGVIFFLANVVNPTQLTALTRDFQASSKYPLLIAMDEEGGRIAKIANNPNFNVPKYTTILELGQKNNPALARELGVNIGTYLKQYGINYNLAPVADVLSNPQNTVVGDRSYGSDPNMVAQMVCETIAGLQSKGVVTAAKHFPGHGDTVADTHKEGVVAPKTWQEMLSCELIPFKAAIDQGVDSMMVGHISTPNVTTDGLPTSLSYQMMTEKLRGELGFQGVIITDALNMGAITNDYSSGEAAVKAFTAGADILLMPKNFVEAYNAVLAAVNKGEIAQARLNESVLRILNLKIAAGALPVS